MLLIFKISNFQFKFLYNIAAKFLQYCCNMQCCYNFCAVRVKTIYYNKLFEMIFD